ncbi:hypothetical protein DH2020_030923 [Rehmannia glutinosa]|uniref:Protein kinase domain-containing protein n=1 Tax=Rehmannia glutinosa TaxID=99300 RepID=A0ABR0VJD6_REHGL
MKVLGNCRHVNVAAPRACYFSDKANGKLIVYDYYSQGSLSDMLHGKKGHAHWESHFMIAIRKARYTRKKDHVNWESHLKIAIGAVRGIAHIHTQFGAHGNIKSSNIFLNSQHYGCVSDFDLSGIMVNSAESPHRATLGYHSPTYDYKTVSQESDVYSFGNLLLELLTGKSPMQAQGFEKDLHLVKWARSIKYEERTSKLFDKSLRRPIQYEKDVLEMMQTEIPGVHIPLVTDLEELRTVLGTHFQSMARVPAGYFAAQDLLEMTMMLQVAMRCLAEHPKNRPKMCDVVSMLENIGTPKHAQTTSILVTTKLPIFDYGREERDVKWAKSRKTWHGFEPIKTAGKHNYEKVFPIEVAKRKAEIVRLQELHTLKGHIDSLVKAKGLDIDSIHHYYTV